MYSEQDICNVRVKIKCCYADVSVKFIEAKVLGDLEEADCYRKKLLQLLALDLAFCNYWARIEEGVEEQKEVVFSSIVAPVTVDVMTIESVPISGPIQSKTEDALYTDLEKSVNDFVLGRPDLSVRATKVTGATSKLVLDIRYQKEFKPAGGSVALSVPVANATATQTQSEDPDEFVNEDPFCLNDEEIQLLFDKFNALCGCGCADGLYADNLPKYLKA